MPTGEAGQLEMGVVGENDVAKGRVLWSANTRPKFPKNKQKKVSLTQTGTRYVKCVLPRTHTFGRIRLPKMARSRQHKAVSLICPEVTLELPEFRMLALAEGIFGGHRENKNNIISA